MSDPATYRDSTQIVLPCRSLDGIRDRMETEFTVTVFSRGERCRIIGSPVVIKDVSEFLVRHGVPLN